MSDAAGRVRQLAELAEVSAAEHRAFDWPEIEGNLGLRLPSDYKLLAESFPAGWLRQMIVLGLGRSKDPRAVPLLVGLLGDEDVAAHAVMALGRLRPLGVRPAVERLLDHPQALVRREAKKALARLPA